MQRFFLDTLNIKEGIVRGDLKKLSKEGFLLPDKRGKKPSSNKLSIDRFSLIKRHTFSFPAMESHYSIWEQSVYYLNIMSHCFIDFSSYYIIFY